MVAFKELIHFDSNHALMRGFFGSIFSHYIRFHFLSCEFFIERFSNSWKHTTRFVVLFVCLSCVVVLLYPKMSLLNPILSRFSSNFWRSFIYLGSMFRSMIMSSEACKDNCLFSWQILIQVFQCLYSWWIAFTLTFDLSWVYLSEFFIIPQIYFSVITTLP